MKLFLLLDNGHGTRAFTKGKCSPDKKLYEGEWTREFVSMLCTRLKELGLAYYVVVPEEADVTLGNRCLRANTVIKNMKKLGYDCLFISTHCNAAKSDGQYHNASGWTCWIYTNGSSKSKKIGQIMAAESKKRKLTGNRTLPAVGYYTANFYVLKNTDCPAILCENMFMDNEEDEQFLLSKEGKEQLIELYIISILQYMETYDYK